MTNTTRQQILGFAMTAGFALLQTNRASAADYTWLPSTTPNSWSVDSNWDPAVSGGPDAPGVSVLIGSNIGAASTINLFNTGDPGDAIKTVGRLDIGDADNTHVFTLASGTGAGILDFDGNGNPAQLRQLSTSKGITLSAPITLSSALDITNASANTLSFGVSTIALGTNTLTVSGGGVNFGSSPISGSGYIVINSIGSVNFGNVNTTATAGWTGGITLNSGTLQQSGYGGGDSGVPGVWGRGLLTINGGGLAGGNNTGRAMLISGQVWNADWSFSGGKNVNLGIGAVSLGTTGGTTRTITSSSSALLTIGGAISDGTSANSLTKAGPGPVLLTGANIYSGLTTVDAGTLQFGTQVALYNNTPANWTAENIIVNSGAVAAFNVGGGDEFTADDLDLLLVMGTEDTGFTSGAFIGIDTTSATGGFTYDSGIANPNGGANALGLSKLGANTLVLSGANSYTGGTVLNGGTLQLSGAGTLGNGPVTVVSGTLDINGLTRTLGSTLTLGGGSAPTLAIGASGSLTLGGDVTYASANNAVATISGGTLNLGIPRTFTINDGTQANDLTVSAPIGDGNGIFDVTKEGSGTLLYTPNVTQTADQTAIVNAGKVELSGIFSGGYDLTKIGAGTLFLSGANAFTGNARVLGGTLSIAGSAGEFSIDPNATLIFSSANGTTLTERTPSVTLRSSTLVVNGNSTANSVDAIEGALTVAAADTAGGYSVSTVTVAPNSARNAQLTAGSFVRENRGTLLFRGTNLGANSIASQTANNSNISFTTTPDLVGGGGGAATTTISILPGVIGGTSTSDGGSTFVTYDAINGIRPLDTATEFATGIASGSTSADNVRLTGSGTLATVDAATTINALIIRPSGNSSIDGAGPLTVTSGQIQLNLGNVSSTTTLNAPLDFGTAEGVIVSSSNRQIEIKGGISGSGGLTFCQTPAGSPATYCSVRSSSGSTYTGNTYVLGRVEINSTFLPYGSRMGDVYVHGLMRLNQGGYIGTINGLFGGGSVRYENSGTSYLTIGDNDANGDFTGSLALNGSISVTKIGAGTQRLAGDCTQTRTTTVDGGTLIADGGFICAFTVNTNAILRGKGTIDKSGTAITINNGGKLAPGGADGIGTMTVLQGGAAFANGAKMEVTVGSAGCSAIDVAGSVTGDFTIPVTVNGEGKGKWLVMQAASIEPNFISSTSGFILTLENDATQLWVERLDPTTVIIVR